MAKLSKKDAELYREWFLTYADPALGELGFLFYLENAVGLELDQWQRDFAVAVGRGDDGISVRACVGPGKSFMVGNLIAYRLALVFPQNTVVTSVSSGQAENAILKEAWLAIKRLPDFVGEGFEKTKTRIYSKAEPERSFVSFRSVREDRTEGLQGIHLADGSLMVIVDEASGVHESVFAALSGAESGENVQTVLLSNPTRSQGFFYDSHHSAKENWTTFHVSYKDSRFVTDKFAERQAAQYGKQSNEYRIRVLGEFPIEDGTSIVPMGWARDAQARNVPHSEDLPIIWGVDVAGGGEYSTGKNVIVRRNKLAVLPEITVWDGERGSTISGRIKYEYDKTPNEQKPKVILVDSIGVGAEVFNRMYELGLPVRGVNVAESSSIDRMKFANLKAELWWALREWLESNMHSLPGDPLNPGGRNDLHERLIKEITTVQYDTETGGKIKAESKRALYKRAKLSPDIADALVLTFAEDAAILGGYSNGGWGEPVVFDFGGLS